MNGRPWEPSAKPGVLVSVEQQGVIKLFSQAVLLGYLRELAPFIIII